MPTNVVMPQMGESVTEGTLVRWIKKVGEPVDRDEPLFEISTDKVDAEIPSPAAGVLQAIHVSEGETVPVDSVVAVIAARDEAPAPGETPAPASGATVPQSGPPAAASEPTPAASAAEVPPAPASNAPQPPPAAPQPDGAAAGGPTARALTGEALREHLRRTKSSPLVRRMAREHNVDITAVPGTGLGGRVTKHDILRHLEGGPSEPAPASDVPAAAPAAATVVTAPAAGQAPHAPVFRQGERVEIVPMSVMRKKIAEHMILSRRTSAHVHSVFEVDFQRVSQIREQKKVEYERLGAKLTFMAFIAKATCDALRAVPVVNASIDGENIVYKKDINLGIAVALDWGLIVPVVHGADEKNLLGLSRAINDVARRARSKQLKPEEVQGGTFTITNPGVFGTLFGMPIINQPQVAIMGIGAIEKRVVVIDEAIHVRPRAYLTLGYDHRLVDGAVADEFMSHLKRGIENFDPSAA